MTLSLQSVPVISHSRWLLKKGEVQQMAGPKSTRTMRSKKLHHPVYLFLFNNLLLITKRSSRSAHDITTQRQLVVIRGRSAQPLSVCDFLLPPPNTKCCIQAVLKSTTCQTALCHMRLRICVCLFVSGEKFQVLDSCTRAMLRTEDMEDQGQMLANVFNLKLLENQEERHVSYMLKTSSM